MKWKCCYPHNYEQTDTRILFGQLWQTGCDILAHVNSKKTDKCQLSDHAANVFHFVNLYNSGLFSCPPKWASRGLVQRCAKYMDFGTP
jgi:hypothetical protein